MNNQIRRFLKEESGQDLVEYALLLFLVLAVAIVLRALRWRLLISPEHRPSMRAVTSALLVGYLFNSILPARAGEAIRVVVLRQLAGTPRFEGLGTVIAERAIDVLTLLVLLFAAGRTD